MLLLVAILWNQNIVSRASALKIGPISKVFTEEEPLNFEL